MPENRRALLKKIAYVTPAIITLVAIPAFAAKGSNERRTRAKWIEKGPKY